MTSAAPAGRDARSPVVVWRLSDGRTGHDNQSRGLVEAIGRLLESQVCEFRLSARSATGNVPALLRESRTAPSPRLLIGAGHATHLPLLAARWRRGGRGVVLMRPSLPRWLFDACVVPAHDGLTPDRRTLVTRGAINRVRPSPHGKQARSAMALVGGPSREYGWSAQGLEEQLRALIGADPTLRWRLCDSRRTPTGTRAALATLADARVSHVGFDTVDADWLPRALGETETVWVSEDSASMVYEALSAQAAVGLLAVPRHRPGRVAGGVDSLRAEGLVRSFEEWRRGLSLVRPAAPLAEADRCARWLVERWLSDAA